ncbi:polysaccharide lyase family 1 protein [Tulasnella calospora MUT 4182]|uniref:Polysaccharide lyase family 1 protein n=1 Tax=Tulasnella calospora MUT 4182 TaxID=1051891 RepID=A0A0C3Q6C3_9AGAM|nr:polysaccharide lyase family 1 protein [Tulasnella calospora MUT 4182]
MHYWVWLFAGSADTITAMQNHIYSTAGRGPHIGGISGYDQKLHIVNNYYDTIGGHAIDSDTSSHILAEGNYFKSVTTPDTGNTNGQEYFVQTVPDAAACTSYLGRVCEWNRLESSGAVSARLDSGALTSLAQTVVKNLKPMGVADVPAYVLANAGVGKVN